MCYIKKRLRNRVLESHRTGFDKEFIKAPCGCCPECRKTRSNDWLVRSYYEFLGNRNNVYFVTLDFDDMHLPRFPRWTGKPCFDSDVMKYFLQRLRNRIGPFRYFYVSEFGGLLKRPHYHIIIRPLSKLSKSRFFIAIHKTWQQGHFTDIESLDSVNNNPMKAIEYVCNYTTKDITWDINDFDQRDSSMPMRFRPRFQASKGYGLQALELGYITADMLRDGSRVSLPIGKNGSLVSLPIPRYYEMKLAYDVKYDPETRKTELLKNELGVEIARNRHNRYYIYYIRKFFASRYESMHDYDLSFFNGDSWKNIVFSCVDNMDDFSEFVYYRPFIRSWSLSKYIYDTIRNEFLLRPNWFYYNVACDIFDKFQDHLSKVKCDIEVERLVIAAKLRARAKIRRYPAKYRYLVRKGFDFSQLNI